MKAYVKHKFEKGFCLKEEDLTKLIDFIKVRAREVNATDQLIIKVYRFDSLVYETPTLEALRCEENAIRNRIIRVQLLLKHPELTIDLDFDSDENEWTSLEIEATDRDRAYLLFSELKDYLNTEVLVLGKKISKTSRRFWPLVIPLVFMGALMVMLIQITMNDPMTKDQFQKLLQGDDVQAKLNYLANERRGVTSNKSFSFVLPLSLLALFIEPTWAWFQESFFPRNVFYLGKGKSHYDALLQKRSRWWWGIVISFVVGVISSIAVWLVTKG